MNRTIEVTNNEKIAVTNRNKIYSVIIKKGIFLANSKSLCLFSQIKNFLFMLKLVNEVF